LHQANGGYLILDANKLLMQPYAWEELKRTLFAREIKIESPVQSFVSTISLEPEPIPLRVKVILIGDRRLYYMLAAADPEFDELFKIAADFEDDLDRNAETIEKYAGMIAAIAKKVEVRPLDRSAVARVIEHSAREAGDNQKLSARVGTVTDLLHESSHLADKADRTVISAADVQAAIDLRTRRADRIRVHSLEQIERGTILIGTDGSRVGTINGLSVLQIGGFAFGRPTRITARVRVGRGEFVDIEREVDLGGPTHSKGVLILSSYLGAHYAVDRPLSLRASLVFEQSYGGVDGDSASSTELYAILSALADVPIRQGLAVTGSVNQFGEVQTIGGVNEKIEGFFDVCQERGLTGEQGVLIPEANVKHLMLREDVVAAAEAGKFAIYPIATIDEGIEVLTGIPAGSRAGTDPFPDGSINRLVEDRLIALADARRRFGIGEGSNTG
jgi:predicted ATP-dependent protease